VVDNNSTDITKEIAKNYTTKVYNKQPERSAQRNYGVKNSKGEYVLIIDSDMELTKDVVKACVEKLQYNSKIKALVIPEESFGEGFWAQCKKLERSFYVGVDWMEAARFFERDVFEKMKGYDEQLNGGEDYDLPQRIEAKYGQDVISRIDEYIRHNEHKISLIKTYKKKFYYAKQLDRYRSIAANRRRFNMQANPLARYQLFLSKPSKLIKNPVYSLGMLFMKTTEFLSGALGYLFSRKSND
jgi:glycosyltransferase involved in cell wall biosynthesis